MNKLLKVVCATALVSASLSANAASDKAKLDARIEAAHQVLHEIMATPDKGIPLNITEHATCVAVVPGFKKGAFLLGGQYGQGVVTCRTGSGWSAPAFIQITGTSFGLQAGGQSTDLVLVAVTKDAFDRLLHDKVKLGGDIAASAGPVGRNSQASTSILANTGFLTYSRSKGLFAGIDLTGDVVNQNHGDTEVYYGKDVQYETILQGSVKTRPSSLHFIRTVSQFFRASKAQ